MEQDNSFRWQPRDYLACGAFTITGASLGALCWQFAHTDLTMLMRAQAIELFFAAFGVFLLAVGIIRRMRPELSNRLVWFIVVVGIALRLLVAPTFPATTSDSYRYLWEGRLVRLGINPYAEPPNSPKLTCQRDWSWERVQHKSVSAAYPPVAQYVFASSRYLPGNARTTLKLTFALFDIGTVLLLVSLLARAGLPRKFVILYAWHPLAICEVVARGHFDALGIFLLVLTLRLLDTKGVKGSVLAGAVFAASVLAKGYALFTLPFMLLAAVNRRAFLLGAAALAAVVYLPFLAAGSSLFRGALEYERLWSDNGSIFALGDLMLERFTSAHDGIMRGVCLVAILVWLILLTRPWLRVRPTPIQAARVSLLALMGFFLLSPTVYPWYLAWTLPLLALTLAAERRLSPVTMGCLMLTGTIFAFYAHDFAGHHKEIWWVSLLEYGVPLTVAAIWGVSWRPPAGSSISPPDLVRKEAG